MVTKIIKNANEKNLIKLYNGYTSDALIVQLFMSRRNRNLKIQVLFYPPSGDTIMGGGTIRKIKSIFQETYFKLWQLLL